MWYFCSTKSSKFVIHKSTISSLVQQSINHTAQKFGCVHFMLNLMVPCVPSGWDAAQFTIAYFLFGYNRISANFHMSVARMTCSCQREKEPMQVQQHSGHGSRPIKHTLPEPSCKPRFDFWFLLLCTKVEVFKADRMRLQIFHTRLYKKLLLFKGNNLSPWRILCVFTLLRSTATNLSA